VIFIFIFTFKIISRGQRVLLYGSLLRTEEDDSEYNLTLRDANTSCISLHLASS